MIDISTSGLENIILDLNQAEMLYPIDKTIHQLFEEQVIKTPKSPALVYKNRVLTYEELNRKANQLARHLIKLGVQVENTVAICLKPSFNMIIAILATLKAGGAYIPIDANYPADRIKYLLTDSNPRAIITESGSFNFLDFIDIGFSKENNLLQQIIEIDQFQWNKYSDTNPGITMSIDNLMYIIYTSGSTGLPKGVLIEHHSAVNMTFECIEKLNVNRNSRILQVSSFSFDVSVSEWCMTLLSGASLYLIDKDIFSPTTIVTALRKHKISTIILASSILSAFPREDLPDLKVIATGGEPISLSLVDFWAVGRKFINVYGVTEVAVCSTMKICHPKDINISSGKPIANTKIYILDEQLEPVPMEMPGEIYISGLGVARGYLNNSKLTQEKFIPNILTTETSTSRNQRMYKTGDLGCWTSSGELEILGRLDNQVKIRGYRIELNEIEKVIEKHASVEKAVVVVNEIKSLKILCVYVRANNRFDSKELIAFAKKSLPSYMLPSNIIQVSEYPLTPNGKIDKLKLVNSYKININPLDKRENYNFTSTEKRVVKIIQSLLPNETIPLDENFMDFGFDSVTLVFLGQQLNKEFEFEVDITTLFTYSTIRTLSVYLENYITNSNNAELRLVKRKSTLLMRKSGRVEFYNA